MLARQLLRRGWSFLPGLLGLVFVPNQILIALFPKLKLYGFGVLEAGFPHS